MRKLWNGFRNAATAVILLWALVTAVPGPLHHWIRALCGPWSETNRGTLILLGADVIGPDMLSGQSYWRAVHGLWEWRRGGFDRIVVSGGYGCAEAMRDFLVRQGVPESAVRLENRSRSTRENACFTAEMLKNEPGPKTVLTSDYHSRRAWLAFRRCGLAEVDVRASPYAGKLLNDPGSRWSVLLTLAGETVKLAWYRLQGWV